MGNASRFAILQCILLAIVFTSCHKNAGVTPQLSVSSPDAFFTADGGEVDITITSNIQWSIDIPSSSWLQLSQTTGNSGSTLIKLTASANVGSAARSVKLSITAPGGVSVPVSVSQVNRLYPSYNTSPIPADSSGMGGTAAQVVANMTLGWNIGNSLEAIGGETAWGNPMVTSDLIKFVKQSGFSAIRIPCSWNQYADQATAKIQTSWLTRVKQVVQYCIDNDLYVILNIHWDGGWLEDNCTPDKKDSVNAKQKAFWEQIATTMRDFDQHLIFASANEPAVSDATGMSVLLSYHQTFINAVRSTGGKNAYRVLDVQGPSTDIGKTVQLFTTMPTDSLPNKLMLEVHWYSPYQFTLMTEDADWGNAFYYWGQGHHSTTDTPHNATSGNEESLVDMNFRSMKDNFVSKGIPVMIGEFDAIRRSFLTGDSLSLSLASRAYFFKYVVQQATANGLAPFYWDAGGGVVDRTNNTVLDQQALDSLRSIQ